MRFGVVVLPEHRWPQARELWQRADAMRFEHVWTYDHIAWRSFRDRAWFAGVPVLTAAAAVTSRARIGLLVASPNFRHPVPFAKEMMTIDDISGGRLIVGIGAGGGGWDATVLGQEPWSPRERADRFLEFVEITDKLLRQSAASHRGRYYCASEARTYPGCLQLPRPPLALAATGPRGMRLVARHADIWVTTGERRGEGVLDPARGASVVREQIERLEAACAAVGRDPSTLARLVLSGPLLDPGLQSRQSFQEATELYEAAGVTDFVVHWPRPGKPYETDPKVFDVVFAQ
ncbi:MAG TPA: LLM class flavin-dependent oxidoreductase [Candidatus Limnocylindrales bacterium]|nr:LLM class flavin-dependent oxidoreductase [Candidatus Limnocylindrales bacterium]